MSRIRAFMDRAHPPTWIVQDEVSGAKWRAPRVEINVPAELVIVGTSAGHLTADVGQIELIDGADGHPGSIVLRP